jgi:hypothetical protein
MSHSIAVRREYGTDRAIEMQGPTQCETADPAYRAANMLQLDMLIIP